MNQLINLSSNLPTGDMRNSIQSPRTNILMQLEHNRRTYNRINNEQLDLYTFIHMIGNPNKVNGMMYLKQNALQTLHFLIITELRIKPQQRKRGGIYSKNIRL